MSLYTYSIFLMRETARGSFVDDLTRAGLLVRASDDLDLLGLRCGASIGQAAGGITTIELVPNVGEFERLLVERGNELVSWLWRAIEEAGLLYAFIPSGDDTKVSVDGVPTRELVWTQLPELIETGRVRIAHPVMVFAERVGQGRPCERVKALDWGGPSQCRAGVGCVIAVTTDETDRGFEILEVVGMEPALEKAWA